MLHFLILEKWCCVGKILLLPAGHSPTDQQLCDVPHVGCTALSLLYTDYCGQSGRHGRPSAWLVAMPCLNAEAVSHWWAITKPRGLRAKAGPLLVEVCHGGWFVCWVSEIPCWPSGGWASFYIAVCQVYSFL